MSLEIRVYQGDTSLNQTVTFNLESTLATRKNVGKIVGTIVDEVYANARYYREVGSRLFKGNEPVLMRITMQGKVIDLGDECTFERKVQQKFKLQISEAGEKRYAQRVYKSVMHSMREQGVVSDDKLKSYEFGK